MMGGRRGAKVLLDSGHHQKGEWMAKTIRISDRPIGGGLEV